MATFEFMPVSKPNAMRIALGMNAVSFISQLTKTHERQITDSLERFAAHYDALQATHVYIMHPVRTSDGRNLRTYRVTNDVRAFFYFEDETIYIVDMVTRNQLERINSLRGSAT